MNNKKTNIIEQQTAPKELLPSAQSILEKLSIDPSNIKFIKPKEKRSNYIAILNWLTEYKANSNAPNLEKIKGL